MHDICQCETSLSTSEAVDVWNKVILGVLSHSQATGKHLMHILELRPDFAMGHALKGLSALLLGRRELIEFAQSASNQAQLCLKNTSATQRERHWCYALQTWLSGSPTQAIAHMEAAMRLNAADTLSMKLSHAIRFLLGDSIGMRQSIEAVMPAHGTDHPLRGYILGCLSFALEETGSYRDAEKNGLLALESVDDDAWGLHAVAHVYDMSHRVDEGIALIDQNKKVWNHCNNFRFHVWWHKALLHLDQADYDQALNLYDTQIRSEQTDDYRDFSNASSLLTRLELEGVNVGHRWQELAELAEKRMDDGCLVFADLHYMLALMGDDRTDAATYMIARVAKDAKGKGEMPALMLDPGLAAAKGLAAFGETEYGQAFAYLRNAQPNFPAMGGSHAQRDVFERLTIEAGLRAGQFDATEALLKERTKRRMGYQDKFAETRHELLSKARQTHVIFAAE